MFFDMTIDDLYKISGGLDMSYVASGVIFASVGVGLCAIGCIPGVGTLAVTALVVSGVHTTIGGVCIGTIGLVKK